MILETYLRAGTVPYSQSHLTQLLVHRDGLSPSEANDLFEETLQEIRDAIEDENFHDVEDILMDNLSVEPDFLHAFLSEL